ncbi:MAG TPA: DUF3667 domain-containing protein, partial [Casimicrobiaceae bacterium]
MMTPDDAAGASGASCRNCGAAAPETYCPQCGQETNLVLPSATAFVREAAGRYVAFDGRMWRTLGNLLLRPGFLTREYFAGRRRRYVRPAKLFITLSIAMFAVFRIVGHAPLLIEGDAVESGSEAKPGKSDRGPNAGIPLDSDLNLDFGLGAGASQRLAPLRRRLDAFNRLPREAKGEQLYYGVLRYAPYASIVLLPVYALLLQLSFVGGARRHPGRPRRYAAHLVFAAHCHAFLFVIGMLYAVVAQPLHAPLVVWAIAYGVVAMKNVYRVRWIGAVLRSALIDVVYLVFYGL